MGAVTRVPPSAGLSRSSPSRAASRSAFLLEARATVLAAQRAPRRAGRHASGGGTLEIATLGSSAIGVLPDALSDWHRAHPDVAVSITTYRHRHAREAAVASGVGDLAIGPPPRRWSGETTILGREEFVVLLSADDPAANAERIGLASLADREWVAFDHDHGLAHGCTPRAPERASRQSSRPNSPRLPPSTPRQRHRSVRPHAHPTPSTTAAQHPVSSERAARELTARLRRHGLARTIAPPPAAQTDG
jgi:DNA-binding transcriptional LysR family regulator